MSDKTHAAQAGAAVPGLTLKQCICVLETIAGRMATLRDLLQLAMQETEIPDDAYSMLAAAEFMAGAVGAMADGAVGGSALGSADRWHYGPNFGAKAEGGAA